MTPEQETPILSIEHWDYQMARKAGHSEIGEMGMFVDVAVIRRDGEIFKVRKVKRLKVHWERFQSDGVYAQEVLQSAERLIEGMETSERVSGVFLYWKDYFMRRALDPEEAGRYAIKQTLHPAGLDDAGLELGHLDRETSGLVAEGLIEVVGDYLKEIIDEFNKKDAGDAVEKLDFMDPRAKRILASAKRKLVPR